MNVVISILVVGLVLRTVLDLATLNRSSLLTDVLYTVIYGACGVAMIAGDPRSVFGYLATVVAFMWAILGFLRYRRNLKK